MAMNTKYALAMSLAHFLETKPLSQITVGDLTNDCGITRMAFYYHFHDIHDLLEWSWKKDAESAIARQEQYADWQDGLLYLCSNVLKCRTRIEHVCNDIPWDLLGHYLYEVVYGLIFDVIRDKARGLHVRQKDLVYITNFYSYAFVGGILAWIKHGFQKTPEELVGPLSLLLGDNLNQVLMNFSSAGDDGEC